MNEKRVLGKTLKELIKINEQEKVKGFIGDVNENTEPNYCIEKKNKKEQVV